MSLSRLALRLAAVETLCPSALIETGPWPTWAGNRVYDSRIAPIADANDWKQFLAAVDGKPLVSIYTEEQETNPIEGTYPAEIEIVELYAEIMIAAGAVVEVDGQEIGSIEAPITDAQHEAMLDMLEQQLRNLLDPQSEAATLPYVKVAMELHHVKSVPMRDAVNRQSRQAARTICFKLKVRHAQAFGKPKAGEPADIAGLPEPLKAVALAVEPTSPAGQLLRQIALGQPPRPTRPPLDDIRVATNLDRGVAPTNFEVGNADGPDIVSDVQLPR